LAKLNLKHHPKKQTLVYATGSYPLLIIRNPFGFHLNKDAGEVTNYIAALFKKCSL